MNLRIAALTAQQIQITSNVLSKKVQERLMNPACCGTPHFRTCPFIEALLVGSKGEFATNKTQIWADAVERQDRKGGNDAHEPNHAAAAGKNDRKSCATHRFPISSASLEPCHSRDKNNSGDRAQSKKAQPGAKLSQCSCGQLKHVQTSKDLY